MTIENPQDNAPVEQVHVIIPNMLVTKELYIKVFDYIDPWGETLSYIAWYMKAYYRHPIQATGGQTVFGREILFNLASVVDW